MLFSWNKIHCITNSHSDAFNYRRFSISSLLIIIMCVSLLLFFIGYIKCFKMFMYVLFCGRLKKKQDYANAFIGLACFKAKTKPPFVELVPPDSSPKVPPMQVVS